MKGFAIRAMLFAGALLLPTLAHAQEKGWFGIGFGIESTQAAEPVVIEVRVQGVAPESPAAGKVAVGDSLEKIDGKRVDGVSTQALGALLYREVGQSATIELRNAAGKTYVVRLVAARRPDAATGETSRL